MNSSFFEPKDVLRYPRLDTVLMIEKALYKHRSDKTITQIWKSLPKKVMWQTYSLVLDYLEHSGKIYLEPDKTVTWLWNPKLLERVKSLGVDA
ncbi:MAG: hypothetical protein V1817_01990 [Candidatus Micrarchaeota archaeon]